MTKEQLESTDKALTYMLSGIPAAMMNSGTAGFASTYGYHGDFGIPAIHFATESMLEDIAVLGEMGYYWFGAYYQNTSQGSDYIWCAFFWNQYYKWIKLINDIINVVGEVDGDTSKEERNILGQALAYRALYYLDLARLLVDMIETDKYGFYHATNEGGYISWHDFAVAIFEAAYKMGYEEYSKENLTVSPVTTKEYGVSKAARPFNSRLDKSKLVEAGFTPLPTWQDALGRYLKEIEF